MTTILGIRHHGPGCARSLRKSLETLQPDLLLIEGPAGGDALIPDAASTGMKPPVAMLFHQIDNPQVSSFYPFAEFSPEWQALLWASEKNTPPASSISPAPTALPCVKKTKLPPNPPSIPSATSPEPMATTMVNIGGMTRSKSALAHPISSKPSSKPSPHSAANSITLSPISP
jgi:hypothetical protein